MLFIVGKMQHAPFRGVAFPAHFKNHWFRGLLDGFKTAGFKGPVEADDFEVAWQSFMRARLSMVLRLERIPVELEQQSRNLSSLEEY